MVNLKFVNFRPKTMCKWSKNRFGATIQNGWGSRDNGIWHQTIIYQMVFYQTKGNQTMKLSQLIDYNKINIFIQTFCRKWGWEASSRPLYYLKMLKGCVRYIFTSLFRMPKREDLWNKEKAFTSKALFVLEIIKF